MVMLVASLALVIGRAGTPSHGEQVCFADEPDALFLLQSGPGLRAQGVFSLLQTSEPDVHSYDSVEPMGNNNAEGGNQQDARGNAAAAGVGARSDTRGHGAVTIVMPQRTIGNGIVLATSKQNVTLRNEENRLGGHVDTDGESGKHQDDKEDHVDSKHTDEIPDDNGDKEDTQDTHSLSVGDPDEATDAAPATTGHTPDIFEIPSEKCQKPCLNGICHDGECFCRYPFVGLQCEIVAITEIGKVLAITMLSSVALFTALCVFVVFRANQKTSAAVPVQEPHMADEEWLPPATDTS